MIGDFEKLYNEFISKTGHDLMEHSMLIVVRTAFIAGWLAAGGEKEAGHGKVNKPGES